MRFALDRGENGWTGLMSFGLGGLVAMGGLSDSDPDSDPDSDSDGEGVYCSFGTNMRTVPLMQ